MELTVMSARGMDSRWGTTILYKMRDASGNVFTWFSSGGAGLEAGKTIKLDATVKAHGEYKGVRETVLTRAKEV